MRILKGLTNTQRGKSVLFFKTYTLTWSSSYLPVFPFRINLFLKGGKASTKCTSYLEMESQAWYDGRGAIQGSWKQATNFSY